MMPPQGDPEALLTAEVENDQAADLDGSPSKGWPWRDVLLAVIVSRVSTLGLVLLLPVIFGDSPGIGNEIARGDFFQPLLVWDGSWYRDISLFGYSHVSMGQASYPFFPLLPGILAIFSWLGMKAELAGPLVNIAVFTIGLVGVYQLTEQFASRRAARLAIWTLALFPAATMFSLVYPSAILLASSVWAFNFAYRARSGRGLLNWWLASGCAVFATLVRPNGLVVAMALAVAAWPNLKRIAIVVGPSVVAIGAWMLVLWSETGNPFIFAFSKGGWHEETIWSVLTLETTTRYVFFHFFVAILGVAVIFKVRKRIPAAWIVFALLYLVPSLALGVVGLARYTNECFPVFVGVGMLLEKWRPRWRIAYFATSAVALGIFTYGIMLYRWVP